VTAHPRAHAPSAATNGSGPTDDEHERYVLACAVLTTAAKVLADLHTAVGSPRAARSPQEASMLHAAAQARSAAGAMSVVAGRMLTQVRDHDQRLLPDLPRPVLPQPGVTSADPAPAEEWRATVRGLAGAVAECEVALQSCRSIATAGKATSSLTQLHSLAGMTVALLERAR
jgi:hypothetical protein